VIARSTLIACGIFLLSSLLPSWASAQDVQTDYNADAISDLTLVEIADSGELSWTAKLSGSGEVSARGTLGKEGDQLILADWLGTGAPQIGVAALDGSSIIWKILDSENAVQQRTFGASNDLLISGGDYNGNGIADAAVARLRGRRAVWELKLDMFSPSEAAPMTITFGQSGDRAFFASPDGGSDWLAMLGKGPGNRSRLRMKNLVTGEVRTYAQLPAFASANPRPRPFPVKQADGSDALGFIRGGGSNTRVQFVKLDGHTLSRTTLPGQGDLIVGDFNEGPGEEVAIKTSDGFFIYNPVLGSTASATTLDGIAVDEININQLVEGGSNTGGDGDNNSGEEPPTSTNACSSIVDISTLSNVLYKNENLHGSRGRTWLDQGHRMGGTRTLKVLGLDGVQFACFGLYACDQPFGCRYYQAQCRDSLSNSQFINAAKQHGGGRADALVSSGRGVCFKFKADAARYGNIIK
jgi:hypothetical protein